MRIKANTKIRKKSYHSYPVFAVILIVSALSGLILAVALALESPSAPRKTESGVPVIASQTEAEATTAKPTEPTEPTMPVTSPSTMQPIVTVTHDFTLRFNELMASNSAYSFGADGIFCDWIELYNFGANAVTLSGFILKVGNDEYTLDDSVLEPGTYITVYSASGKEIKLPKSGARVDLIYGGEQAATVTYSQLNDNASYAYNGIVSGGELVSDEYIITTLSTPGYENTFVGLEAYCAAADTHESIVINEVMTSNTSLLECKGKYYDWIEIKNNSAESINIGNYYLSDSLKKLNEWKLPDITLSAGEMIVFIASGDETLNSSKFKHTSFKLNGISECVYLSKNGKVVEAMSVTGVPSGGSYGRLPEHSGYFYFETPTPKEENKNGYRAVAMMPKTGISPGTYDGVESISVKLEGDGDVYYTLDGSEPNLNAILYDGEIILKKTSVVRAVSYNKDKALSRVMTSSFFINENHSLPIVSIAIEPEDFWSNERGIYAIGNGSKEFPYKGANFLLGWERKANASLYETGKDGFSIDCGIGISGSGSRSLDKKSFSLKFKTEYGCNSLEYEVFDGYGVSSFTSLRLRAGEDYPTAIIREELFTSLCADSMPQLATHAYKYCVLYINAEYFGIYAIKEKTDEDYVASREGVQADTVTLIEDTYGANYGTSAEILSLRSYVSLHSMKTDEYYEYVKTQIDFESLIDWAIAQIYTGNRDLANVRFYKTDAGKWTWVLYDLDWGFFRHENSFYLLRDGSQSNRMLIIRCLSQNDEFKDLFLTRLGYHLNYTFAADRVIARIDSIAAVIDKEVARERTRWLPSSSYSRWRGSINDLKKFVNANRKNEVINDAKAYFGLSSGEAAKYFELKL